MKRALLLLLTIACTSCAKDHGQPPVDLDFVSIERKGDLSLYVIHYHSTLNLLNLYGRGIGEGIASTQLICALGSDYDFSIEHEIEHSAYGRIQQAPTHANGPFSDFITEAFLSETLNKGQSRRNLTDDELNRLLASKKTIPCKAVITAYGYKPYYSKPMELPVKDLLREINKPKTP
ncbi:hypothetical protein SAMN05660489_06191 [Pseudomonas sp. LAMO17WK12:I10]|uniref:hypothetical protein n=1 Tax=unclassified Pseudomonas TaxID=196821 RepID=UPI000BC824FD|nr:MULTISPECIES: hypothetical protein [unclassified Pseudomonas]PXX52165.1 hypothetical protein H160_06200 [Pseudomonas sp. LAMO17WK12:I9]SNY53438.1 hypothetical protein SAMN05660489_06191 [Pseudomonas sp. LAMO17WK12:I10]